MNTRLLSFVLLGSLLIASGAKSFAQEEAAAPEAEASSAFDAGVDIYSSYIWRGLKFGSGPAFQPWVEGSIGGFSAGAWGSVNSGPDEGFEMDLYAGYGFDFGLSIAITDYYFGGAWMDFENNHYFEPSISYETGSLGFTAAFMLNPGTDEVLYGAGAAGSSAFMAPDPANAGNLLLTPATDDEMATLAAEAGRTIDLYFEASYAFSDNVSLTVGAGNGAYTNDGDDTYLMDAAGLEYVDANGTILKNDDEKVIDEKGKGDLAEDGAFMICNVTLGVSKEIEITEKFSLPLSGAVTLNPATGGFFATVGVSF